jgi:hypothetical protein
MPSTSIVDCRFTIVDLRNGPRLECVALLNFRK